RGTLRAAGKLEQVLARVSGRTAFEIVLKEQADAAAAELRGWPAVADVAVNDHTLTLYYGKAADEAHEILTWLVEKQYKVLEVRRVVDKLEDVFMKLTTGAVQ